MTELAYTEETGFAGIKARELTLSEIRTWLKSGEDRSEDRNILDITLFDDAELADIQLLTDATPEVLETLRPSELRAILDVCKRVNSDFFGWRVRIAALASPAENSGET